ncbi:MAG: type II secretion system F family protein [Acidobacteria bacterium]|nr:type II secretion system F family protein [Acidobacteriota bacterium]
MASAFYFKAVTPEGKVRTGTLNGENDKEIARELRKQGLTPVYVGLEAQKGLEFKMPDFGGSRKKDVLFFTTELTTLLNSGITVDRALQISTELTEKPQFRMVVLDVLRVLKGGRSLADSLATHPEYFGDLYVNMVRAGEASGSLGVIFERLAEFEKTRDELRSYIISSMVYPALLSLVGVGSVFVLMNFVVPRFAQVFEQGNIPMPLPTKMMIEASHATQTYGPFLIGALIVGAVAFQAYIRTREGRLWWDGSRLKIPLLGDALRKAETARFARAMGTLIANSVPLVQSLGIAGAILNNRRMAGALEAVSMGVKRGEGISTPLRKTNMFPPLAAHLLSVGEETGKLDTMFLRMADVYEADTKAAIRRFTSLFEPLIILIMGVIIGALVISLLLAISSINEVAV